MSAELCLVEYVCTTDKTLLPFPIKTRRVEKRNPVPCIFATLPTTMPTLCSQKYWWKSDVISTIFYQREALGQVKVFRCSSSSSWQDVWLKQKNCAFWFMVSSLFALLGYPRSFCKFHNTKTSCCFFAVISYGHHFYLLLFGLFQMKNETFLRFFFSS